MTTHTATLTHRHDSVTHSASPSPSATASTHSGSRGLRAGLWLTQGALALGFGFAGVTKALTPLADAAKQIPWIPDVPAALVRFIGAMELAAAVGLVLPALTRIRPRLTPVAAAGLVLIMIFGALFHLTRGEPAGIAINAVLGSLAAFVAWGRFRKAPISPR